MTLALSMAFDRLRMLPLLFAAPPPPPPPPPPPGGGAPPPPPAPGGYAPPPMSGGPAEQAPNAITALILSILGLVVCYPCCWVGFFMAKGAMQQYPNCGITKAAYWVGLIGGLVYGLFLIVWLGIVCLGAMAGMAGS